MEEKLFEHPFGRFSGHYFKSDSERDILIQT